MEQVKQPIQSSSSPSESQTAPNRQGYRFYNKEADYLEPELAKKLHLTTPFKQIDLMTDKAQQDSIMKLIENVNIERIVSENINKFNPPYCESCPSRRADRVCVNKACGNSFMQLICGKCHYEKHRDSVTKPEIDIEEYFTKLAKFLNSTQHDNKKNIKTSQSSLQLRIDKDTLPTLIDLMKDIHQGLAIIKEILLKVSQEYVSPTQMVANLQNSIIQALSLCETENIAEQLSLIKHNVIFEKNGFQWKDADKQQIKCTQNIGNLDVSADLISKIISKLIFGGVRVDLTDVNCLYGKPLIIQASNSIGSTDFKVTDDGEITMVNTLGDNTQTYISYELNPSKKYRLIFKFNNNPSQYLVAGVFPLSQIKTQLQYCRTGHYFCKRFKSPCATHECSRILKGTDLSIEECLTEQNIEIRVDFESNYMDFSDYPDHKNVNANNLTSNLLKEPYVFAFNLDRTTSITIKTIEELILLDEYC